MGSSTLWPQGRICASGKGEDAAGKDPQAASQLLFARYCAKHLPHLISPLSHAVCLQEGSDLPERLKWDSQLSLSPEPDEQYKVPQGCCGRVLEERGSLCPTLLPLFHLFPNNTLCVTHPWAVHGHLQKPGEQAWP